MLATALAASAGGPELSAAEKQLLDASWQRSLRAEKGPYSKNYCVCRDGAKKPVELPDGRLVSPCGGAARFCAGFREPWAEELAKQRMYIANLFARDLWLWDSFPDHHDLVRGYILEKFFFETHPTHKLAQMRAYGGLAGAEFEARDAPLFFERYLAMPEFDEARDYLLAFELQRRFYVREDQGQITTVRNMASAIQSRSRDFKPLRDLVHNQISPDVIPRLASYRDARKPGEVRDQVDRLIAEVAKLTSLDESALKAQLPDLEDAKIRGEISAKVEAIGSDPVAAVQALANVMLRSRREVEAKRLTAPDRRRLIDIGITAAAIIGRHASQLLASDAPLSARRHLDLLLALADAAYGSGLLMEREREAVTGGLRALLSSETIPRREFEIGLRAAARAVEWAQLGTNYAFEEVRPAWHYLLPDTALLADDVLRGSVLLPYGQVLQRLQDWASGGARTRHELFGEDVDSEVRALNSGLALGPLRVAPAEGGYSREDVVALPETPADLEPAAGILTRGEGNVVSHVQLLARALGIPNVVLGPSVYQRFAAHDGRDVFFIVTPGGRVILKDADAMTAGDHAVVAEYNGNRKREGDGSLAGGASKLHIDKQRIDLGSTLAIDLASLRRADSGIRGGPKAAYLGELKHLFPDHVARGIVVPFGAYHEHYRRARVTLPEGLAGRGIAEAGAPLHTFVEQSYTSFFGEMMPGGSSEQELRAWIEPRLAVMRASIEAEPLSDALTESIRSQLARLGLLKADDPSQTVGVFVRSDTNVEDLDDFNGAGLNLTLFNRHSLADVLSGLKQVWASPFSYRSFSWRQALIDEPLWVLPSVVILESVPTEKSGVLVTSDVDRGDPNAMLVATSEGVGGAVDGSPAETLVYSERGVELITMFKSPWRRLLRPEGGSAVVPSTRGDRVLSESELAELVSTAAILRDRLAPSLDASGEARPWDLEYGFAGGELWLFQVRPFLGNESLQNIRALAVYEPERADSHAALSLDDPVP